MTRVHQLIAPLAAAAALAACGASEVSAADSAPAAEAPYRTLTVSGRGEAPGAPDMAVVSVGVHSEAQSAGEAIAANNRDMNGVIDALKKMGVASKDLQTSRVSLSPQYEYDERGQRRVLTRYAADNQVTARIRDLSKVGPALDAIVAAGGNTIDGLSFTFADPAPHQANARKAAVKDAQEKAKLYADAAGVALGPILTINEGGDYSEPVYAGAKMMRMEDAAPMPVEAGETSISASVSVVYEIR